MKLSEFKEQQSTNNHIPLPKGLYGQRILGAELKKAEKDGQLEKATIHFEVEILTPTEKKVTNKDGTFTIPAAGTRYKMYKRLDDGKGKIDEEKLSIYLDKYINVFGIDIEDLDEDEEIDLDWVETALPKTKGKCYYGIISGQIRYSQDEKNNPVLDKNDKKVVEGTGIFAMFDTAVINEADEELVEAAVKEDEARPF